MNNKNTNSILHSSFCFQQRDVHLNQKGFGLIGALIGGVISLIVIGTVNNLVLRSIKKSSKTEKIMRILNDKQRIIGWFKNNLVCARTLEKYPMTETEKTAGKTLYDSTTTKLEIRKSSSSVLESFAPGSLNSIEKIIIKKTSGEHNYALFFYEKSLDSENPLYERKPQEAAQPPIVTCGTTTGGNYVINKCGPACLLCPDAGQERFNGTCIPKCNEGEVRLNSVCTSCAEGEESFEGLCVPVCTGELTRQDDGECGCAGGQEKTGDQCQCPNGEELIEGQCPVCTGGQTLEQDDDGNNFCKCPENQLLENGQCVCPGRLVLGDTGCRKGKDCDYTATIIKNTGRIPRADHVTKTRHAAHFSTGGKCKDDDGNDRRFCTTRQGHNRGFPAISATKQSWHVYYCNDGIIELVKGPYEPEGSCSVTDYIEQVRNNRISTADPERELETGDIMIQSQHDPTSSDPTKQCYTPP